MKWNWRVVQVVVPILGPVVLSALFAFACATGPTVFQPELDIIVALPPRALTFYCLVLISMTVSQFWHRIGSNPAVGGAAILTGAMVAVYYAFTVVWRHDPAYIPTSETYYVTLVLTAASVLVCHMCQRRLERDPER